MSFKLEIVTPKRSFFSGEVERVIVRGIEGDLAVLKNKTPLITPLDIGMVRILVDGEEKIASVVDGYISVAPDETTIVTDSAEWPEEIDEERALRAKERAKKRLEKRSKDTDLLKAELALKRAINRLNVVK